MNATRIIAGRPVRGGVAVGQIIQELVAATLDTSPHIVTQEVRKELRAAVPALTLLASGGYIANGDLVLVAAGLRLTIKVPVGEEALSVRENHDAPRGAATATDWVLHLPTPPGMADIAESAAASCPHVSTGPPSELAGRETAAATAIDLTRLVSRSGR